MAKFPFPEWRAEQLRLTVFPIPSDTLRDPEWWEEMIGGPPDEKTTNPKKGSAVVQGKVDTGKLLLRLESERIDWIIAPSDLEEEMPGPDFTNVGTAPEAIDQFAKFVETWLAKQNTPAITRLAFGGVLLHQEVSKRESYERLGDYLPLKLDPNASDFLMQINLPVIQSTSGIPGLEFNRLSKWSVAIRRVVAFTLARGAGEMKDQVPEITAVRLELDINTLPTFSGEISRDRIVQVFQELVEHGKDLATNGVPST